MSELNSNTINFSTLVMSFATATLMNLGLAPGQPNETLELDLGQARTNIEILKILKEKCKGNLSPEEDKLLQGVLVDLQIKFSKKKTG